MKPCHDRHPVPVDGCRLCWLAAHVRGYQRLWGLPETGEYERAPEPTGTVAARTSLVLAPCLHLGARIAGEPCGSPLLRCTLHGDITTRFSACKGARRLCSTCPDYAAVPSADHAT